MDRVSDDVVIAKIEKNSRETVVVTTGDFNGHSFVGVRIWVPGNDGELVPTKKGLTLAPAKVPELIVALERAAVS